jgi:DeoR/GlpR family transcriptional regulator of sugar metabolism
MLKIDIRRGKILQKLKDEGTVSVTKLASELGATAVTIRSDLDALEKDGYLVRVQGGAVQKPQKPSNDLDRVGGHIEKREEKVAIAKTIAKRIHDGDTLFLNSGTTIQLVAAALREHKNLNIVTNSLAVAMELGSVPTFRVILLGGEINTMYGFTHGYDAQEQLSHYQADRAILTLDGFSASNGMTTYHAEESSINQRMMAQAKEVIVAADSTKIGRTGFFRFNGAEEAAMLVTDNKASQEAVEEIRRQGVAVVLADAEEE